MALGIGLGITLGRLMVGGTPSTDVNLPAALIQSKSNIVVVGAEALNPSDLVSMVTSKTTSYAYHINKGVTEGGGAGTGVTAWADLGPGTINAAAAGTQTPTLTAAGGPGGTRCLTLNGTSHGMTVAFNPPAPGTTPTFHRVLARVTAGFTSGGQLICGSSTNRLGIRVTTGPVASAGNGVNGTTVAIATGTWYLWDALFNNSTTDFLRIGNIAVSTGVNLGNTDLGSMIIGAGASIAAAWLKCEICYVHAFNGQPTTAELNAQAAWLQKIHGAANINVPTYP